MNTFGCIIISLFILAQQGCGSKKNSAKTNGASNYHKTDSSVVHPPSDSMPKPVPPPPGLPPGHAMIEGEVIKIVRVGNSTSESQITIKITDVLGYGSSTPALASEDSIEVRVTNLQQKDIQIGKFVTAVLSYQLMLGETGSSSRWALVKVEQDSK